MTVNDYLARRDAEWMGQLYSFLGLTAAAASSTISRPISAASSTQCDITYGTNSEFGFDYLRDNGMATTREQQVQRGYHYAIVDEVDSILIDEARTPLIISGPATVSTHQYDRFKPLVDQLVRKQNDALQPARHARRRNSSTQGEDRRGRPAHVQGETRPAAQQAAAPHDGGPGKTQGDRQGRTLVLHRHAQGGTLRSQGRALLHHGREVARSRSLRAGPRRS